MTFYQFQSLVESAIIESGLRFLTSVEWNRQYVEINVYSSPENNFQSIPNSALPKFHLTLTLRRDQIQIGSLPGISIEMCEDPTTLALYIRVLKALELILHPNVR